jgi:galactokinase
VPRERAKAFAPGRVNLIGEHTDYNDGLALPFAITEGVTVTAVAVDAGRVEAVAADLGEEDAFELGRPGRASGWRAFVRGTAAELQDAGFALRGARLEIAGTVTRGAGLSSSAALEVAVATALCAVAGFGLDPLGLAQACRRAELRAVGVPCGILDQGASVLGREDCAILLDTASLEHRAIPLPAGLAIVVVDSGVTRTLERSGYAARQRELEEALAALGGRGPREVPPA